MKKFKFNKVSIIVLALAVTLGLAGIVGAWNVYTNPSPVNLGTTGTNFVVLAGAAISDTGSHTTSITGNVGLSPTGGAAITVLSCSQMTGTGRIYDTDGLYPGGYNLNTGCRTTSTSVLDLAKSQLSAAYNNIIARTPDFTFAAAELGGEILGPGIYNSAPGTFQISTAVGSLTLDGGGNPNAVFIFKAASTLKTIGDSSAVNLINGAQACNVFWQVGSSATLDTKSAFKGTIMAAVSIGDAGSSTVAGRLLADANNLDADSTGAVTLDKTTLTVPTCVPSLLLQKAIAGGGPDLNTAWTLTATGIGGSPTNLSGIDGSSGANSDLKFPNATFKADTYTLAETGVSMTNYVATYSCSTVNNGVTTTTTSSSITLVAGDKATCTITNTYTAPTTTLKLVKAVTNNNGGTALNTAWTLTATGAGGFSDNGGTGIFHTVTASVGYVLSESTVAGYTAGNWSCNGGSLSGSTITLSSGQNVTCTITNDDNPAHLIVIKHVINDNAGVSLASSFSTTISGVTTANATAAGAESPGVNNTLTSIGTYSVDEGAHVGYDKTLSADCSGTIALGETKTCTIINDDVDLGVATLTLTKTVINIGGGTKTTTDFQAKIDGVNVPWITPQTLSAGLHTASEVSLSNYTASVWGGDCAANGTITLVPGVNACTITNTYVPPSGGGGGSYTPPVPPLIDLVKVPSPLALPAGPGPVTYTYTLRNIGTVPMTNVTLVDDTCSPMVFLSGDTNADTKLDVNETWTYDCFKTLSATHTNIATAIGWANGISATDISTATVVVGVPVIPPLIHVTKIPNPLALLTGPGMVTYTYTVTNPGTVPLSNVSITDDKCTGLPGRVLGHPGDLNKNDLLESNEVWSFTCKTNLTQTTTNTAIASGSANGLTAKDFAIATVVVSANPSFPKTGFSPQEKNTPWTIIIPVGILITLFSFYATQKKQII